MGEMAAPTNVLVGLLMTCCILPICIHLTFTKMWPRYHGVSVNYYDYYETHKPNPMSAATNEIFTYTNNRSITFVVAPYCTSDKFRYFAETSMKSWTGSSNLSKILIFENVQPNHEELVNLSEEISSEIAFGPQLDTDEIGLPYVDDFITKSFEYTNTDMICLINQDVVIDAYFQTRVSALYNYFASLNQQFAVVGKRCSIDMSPGKDLESLHDAFTRTGSLDDVSIYENDEFSHDFILISKNKMELNFDDIPPFFLGMYHWDMWVVGWLSEQIPVVVLGDKCGSYHIVHRSYSNDLKSKMRENFRLTQVRGEKFGLISKMELMLSDNLLYNRTVPMVQFLEKM